MKCRHGLAMRMLSVRPSVPLSVCLQSVRLSNECTVIKRKKDMLDFYIILKII